MLLTTDNTIQQGTTKVMTFDPANITPIVDGAAGPGMWYLFQFQDPNYVMVASSGEPAGWQISVDTTSLPVRVTATCPLNFSGPYSLSIGISQAQANQLTALGFNVGAANGLGVNIVVAPLQFSVPAQIVPNPPFGILPDPMTFPMWMGDVAPSDSPDSPNGGPASVIETELVHGVATVDSGPDLVIANSIGPDFVFERTYRTAMAAGNLSSPGLTPGWTHNWDYRIAVTGTQNGWAKTLQLVYPNGASDILTPVLDGNNQPTGTLNVPAGAQYRAIGVPDLNAGIWTSITIQSNGVSKSIFTVPSGDTYMRLTSKVFDNGSQVNLSYSASKLTLVDNGAGNSFAVNYAGNLISSVSNSLFSRNFNYVSGKLQSATRINSSAIEWSYSYLSIGGQPYISTVGTTDPAGNNVSASIGYESITGRVQSVTDSKNNPRGYIYNPAGGASITVGPSNSVLDQFSKACDTLGRQSSVTDRGGAITSFAYG
ncbi:MAG: hypothetical protein WCG75_07020, partial [Armatimonadota bacterium]